MSKRELLTLILIGSGNLYPVLNDTVVGTSIDPNEFSKLTSENNLLKSSL